MKKQLEKTWMSKVLTSEQIERYAGLCGKTEEQLTAEDRAFMEEVKPQMAEKSKEQMRILAEKHDGDLNEVFAEFFGTRPNDNPSPEVKERTIKCYLQGWPDMSEKIAEDMWEVHLRSQREKSTYLKDMTNLTKEVNAAIDKDPTGPVGRDIAQRANALDAEYYRGYDELYEFFKTAKMPCEELADEKSKRVKEWLKAARAAL